MPKADIKSELTEGELRFVNQIIGEEPVWVNWVKKINKKMVVQDRLLAVGIYRIFSIKRTKTGKKQIQRAGHILGLKEIFSDDIDRVKLEFGDFRIVVSGGNLGIELPRLLLNCFQRITFTFPESATPKLVLLPAGRNPPVLDSIEPGIAGGLIEVYFAQCDFLNIPPSSDAVTYLEDVCNAGRTHLELDDIVGVPKTSEFTFSLVPLMAALRYNTYFTSFACHDKSRKEVVALIADVIAHNSTLTSVDLTGMEVEEGWVQIGDALRTNPAHKIVDLFLSDNPIGDKAAASIGSGLSIPHAPGLRALRMANTRVTAAGAGAVVKGLCQNRQFGNFVEISFAGNLLKGAAMTFSELVASMHQTGAYLRKIVLSQTQVDLAPLIDGIRNTLPEIIEHLDFTGCKMDDHAAKLAVYLLEKTSSIKQLLLVGCGLTAQPLAGIIHAISSNPQVSDITLDISGNILDSKSECELLFGKSMADAKNIYSLVLREMEFGKLGDELLTIVVRTLAQNSWLREVDLSGNFRLKPKEKDLGLAPLQLLASIIEKHPSIISLIVEGIGQNSAGRNISPIFQCLGEHSKLQKLSVRGHSFGDAGAKELFDILRWNRSLTSIYYDNNAITITGWSFIVRCLQANRTLLEVEYPKIDIGKAAAKATTFAAHDSIFSLFSKIATYTKHNSSGEFDDRGPVPSKPLLDHSYEVRKSSRHATMVISRVVSTSGLAPLSFPPSSPPTTSSSWSDTDSTDSESFSRSSSMRTPRGEYSDIPSPPVLVTPPCSPPPSAASPPPPPPPPFVPPRAPPFHSFAPPPSSPLPPPPLPSHEPELGDAPLPPPIVQ